LRAKFEGTPEKVVQLFTHLAEEVREILASLGFTSLEDVIGRTDLLSQVSRGDAALDDLDLNPILVRADADKAEISARDKPRTEVPDTLDALMVKDASRALENGSKMQLSYNIENTQRAIGTRLSSHIVRRFGMTGLRPGHISVRLRGSAGQSIGAFATQGLRLDVIGDANDYVGKGLSGGMIVVRPAGSVTYNASENTIIGNTVLYGATSGQLFAAGRAGERLCVRNSGATAIVEGSGSNACEYMTGGDVVILGEVGNNFGAGMTGGMAFIYDKAGTFKDRANPATLEIVRIANDHWAQKLRGLVEEHAKQTESALALRLLNEWDIEIGNFWQVVPTEIIPTLDKPIDNGQALEQTA
jgi:glutamate synthase (NADPH/NADH) large chain